MTVSPASPRAQPQSAEPLPGAAVALAAMLGPPLAVFAPLALAPLLAVLAVVLLAADWRAALAATRPSAALAALLALLSAWAAVTALWSPVPLHSLLESLRFLAISAGGLLVLGVTRSLPERQAERVHAALVAGLVLAVLLLQLERHAGEPIARLIGRLPPAQPVSLARYDRGITVLSLLAWPAAARLALQRHWRWLLLLAVALGATVAEFNSHTCILAFSLSLPACLVAVRLPRLVARALFAVVLLAGFLLPLLIPGGAGIEQIRGDVPALPDSAIHRLAIWRFTAEAIARKPLFGWGMDASRAIPGGDMPVIRLFPEVTISPQAQALPLHPHDAALQWRLELGLPGTLIALLLLGLVLERLAVAPAPPWLRATGLGFATVALTVALLSFGAWQAWWVSTLWLAAALLDRLGRNARA